MSILNTHLSIFFIVECNLWWSLENEAYNTKIGSLSHFLQVFLKLLLNLHFSCQNLIFILKSLEQNPQNHKHNDLTKYSGERVRRKHTTF